MKLFKKAHYEKLAGLKDEELEKAALASAANMGAAQTIWHPDFGLLLAEGKLTDAGIEFFRKYKPGSSQRERLKIG